MATCTSCKKTYSPLFSCTHCQTDQSATVAEVVEPCPLTCQATIYVLESLNGTAVHKIKAKLNADEDDTDPQGFRKFEKLAPGSHSASISLAGLEDKYAFPIGKDGAPVPRTIAASGHEFYTFTVDPVTPLKVTVKRRTDSNGLAGAKVKLTAGKPANAPSNAEKTTAAGGDVTFDKLRADTYTLALELDDTAKAKFELEKAEEHHTLDMSKRPDEIVFWATLIIHLRLKYKDPDDTVRPFPKDFALKVVFGDATEVDVKVLDDKGYIKFEVADAAKTKFTLKFDSTKARYLVHEKDKPAPELKEDPDAAALDALSDAGKQFFVLPKVWSLVQSTWAQQGITVPLDGQVAIPPEAGIGTAAAPAELTLEPKLQYVRFEFYDRKYCVSKHTNKRVGIPAVVLKAARESTAAGEPQTGAYDTISNWVVDKASNDDACQCLPWIITKKLDGAAVDKFNKKLLFEFSRDNAWVHSTGDKAAERKLIMVPVGDDRRKPTRDRNLYYDLPKAWKSACYFTRFSDPAKNRFFDESLPADDLDLEASYAKGGKLTFSLDDIVLTTQAGAQAVTDKDMGNVAQPLGPHSRYTMLWLDPADKFKVKVYKPRAIAAYWTDGNFQKELATQVRRNAIVDYPINPRVVVFCDGFHDIHDKRTETADFANKEILGARAARLNDTTISGPRKVFDQNADVTGHYVHKTRLFHMYYLHYGQTDGTTVYGAMVTFWNARFQRAAAGGTNAAVKVFREQGMEHAMKRWNDKDYTFEEADDKKEVVVKHFCLFEAKDTTFDPDPIVRRGGNHICVVEVRDDQGGSSASDNFMTMRQSGALDEGQSWGEPVGTLPVISEYDAGNAAPKGAFAHELGHAAIGLWDDYITGQVKLNNVSSSLWKYTNNNVSMDVDGQRYYGVPYEVDGAPIMSVNRSVRLRYYWGRAKWLNDEASASLVAFLSSKRFRIAYEPTGGQGKLKYSKPALAGYESIYQPFMTRRPQVLDAHGRCDLHLYHLGQDEFSESKTGGPYTGCLVICLKLSACFRIPPFSGNNDYKAGDIVVRNGTNYRCILDHKSGLLATMSSSMNVTQWATVTADEIDRQKVNHAKDLNQRLMTSLQDRFKLQGNGNFATTYIRIFPQWEFRNLPTDAATGGTHFNIEFVFGSSVFTPTAQSIVAGTGCNPIYIMRYVMGKTGYTDFTKDDFGWMQTWMNANAGGRFNVGAI